MSLRFNQKSLSYIIFGFFLLGVLLGALSITHIKNTDISTIVTMPLFWASIIPIAVIIKGIRKAEAVK